MYTLKIYHDVRTEINEKDEPVLVQNIAESSLGFFTGHSYIALNDGGDKPIVRGFYPDNVYKDDSRRIKLAEQYQEKNPSFNTYHIKEIPLNEEQYKRALEELNKYEKYIVPEKKQGILPKEIINGMWRLLGNNCSDFTNTIYRSTGLQGNFTYQYTTHELKHIPGVIEYYIDKFGVGDREHIVSGGSLEDIALKYNVDKSLISEANADNIPMDSETKSMMGLGSKFYKIAPNIELLGNIKHQVDFKPVEESKEMLKDQFTKLSIDPIDYSKFNKIELIPKEELSPRARDLIASKLSNFKMKFIQLLDKFKSAISDISNMIHEKEAYIEKQILESVTKQEELKKLKQKEVDAFSEHAQKELNKKVTDIRNKGSKEIDDYASQMQNIMNTKKASIAQKGQQEVSAFVEKIQAELNAAVNLLRQNNPQADCSALLSQKSAELESYKSKKSQEADQEVKNIETQLNADIQKHYSQKQKDILQNISNVESSENKKIQEFKKAKQEEIDKELAKIGPISTKEVTEAINSGRAKLEKLTQIQSNKIKKYENKVDQISQDPTILAQVKESILQGNEIDFLDNEMEVFIQGAGSAFLDI